MTYYEYAFLFLLLLQEDFKGLLGTFLCATIVWLDAPFFEIMSSQGFLFYEVALFYDAIYFAVGIYLLHTFIGKCLVVSTFLSIITNLIGATLPPSDLYNWYVDNYNLFNIFYLEILVYCCFTSTILYPYLKRKLSELDQKMRKRLDNDTLN